MKNFKKLLLVFIAIFVAFIGVSSFTFTVYAESSQNKSVYDYAGLLNESEEKNLENLASKYQKKFDVDVIFLTYNDAKGLTTLTYTDDFYGEYGQFDGMHRTFGKSGIMFAVDMDNRNIYINTVGTCISAFSDADINNVTEATYEYASDEKYCECLTQMCKKSFSKMSSYYHILDTNMLIPTTKSLIVSVIITAIFLVILFKKHNSANKKISASNYISKDEYIVNNKQVQFVRTYTTVSKDYYKPSSSSSGGGGGSSHSSSSGCSHGGGGHSF